MKIKSYIPKVKGSCNIIIVVIVIRMFIKSFLLINSNKNSLSQKSKPITHSILLQNSQKTHQKNRQETINPNIRELCLKYEEMSE